MVHLYKIGHLTGLRQLSVNVTQGKGLTNVTVPRKLKHCYWYKLLPHKMVVETVQQLFYFNGVHSVVFVEHQKQSIYYPLNPTTLSYVRGGADKSLAQLGRKQATATKLRIYSAYSPWSSIHFLALCCNQPGLRGSNDLCVGWRMANFQLFFRSREQVVVQWGQIRRIRWVIKKSEAQVGQFLLGCKCPVSRGIVVQEQEILGEIPAVFFLSKCPSIAPAEMSNTLRW